ncbi:MAG: flagellar biosynthetic protein FliR [Ignavibacteriales bacterium]|nr:flagellar biosynthetic protein FliR [Ignavibacteriales bacterium]
MTEILIGDFLLVLYIFLRVIAMIIAAPVLGHNSIPAVARIFLSFVIAYIAFLTLDKSKIIIDVNLVSIIVNSAREIITGLIMGFTLNFIFYGISYAGHLIGYDMGLMFSEVLNPMQDIQNNVVGEIIFYLSMMIFLLINGHHHIISAVVASFKLVPIAKFTVTQPLISLIVKLSFAVFTIAMKIAAPIVVSYFLIHIAEGIIARVIPNIQIFFITQPAKIGLGLMFLSILIPIYFYTIKNLLNNYEYQLSEMIRAMSV